MAMMPSLLVVVFLITASPLLAGSRTRAVQTIIETQYSGRVVDARTSQPVIAAEVTSGSRSTRSDGSGYFTLPLPAGRPTQITIRRTGYEPLTVTLTATPAPAIIISPPIATPPAPIVLTPRPPVLVRTTSGTTVTLDADSVQFAYVIPFATPVASESVSLCRADGTSFAPDRSEFRRLTGPAVSVASSRCCSTPASRVTAEMKSGDIAEVFFTESCAGYDVNFAGREHRTAEFVYLKFTEITEVAFP